MDRKQILNFQERVRNGTGTTLLYNAYYFIDSPDLADLYEELEGRLELELIDDSDDNSIEDFIFTADGKLSFTYFAMNGYSYDTPSFGYHSETTVEDVLNSLNMFFSIKISDRLSKNRLEELIVIGCIGDQGVYEVEDMVFIDMHYLKNRNFVNWTYFQRNIQFDDTKIEFDKDYNISEVTYNDEFVGSKGLLSLQGISHSEVVESWIEDDQKIQSVETNGIETMLILSIGEEYEDFNFVISKGAIKDNSNLREIYVDHNFSLEDEFINPLTNIGTKFYVVETNQNAIESIKKTDLEYETIASEDIGEYEGDISETSISKTTNKQTKNTIEKSNISVNVDRSSIVSSKTSNEVEELTENNLKDDNMKLKPIILHYFLLPINFFLPWSIVSWVGIPLAIYARNRLEQLKTNEIEFPKAHVAWTNIAIGVFVFYLVMSLLRSLIV